jgi:hypothetical protein
LLGKSYNKRSSDENFILYIYQWNNKKCIKFCHFVSGTLVLTIFLINYFTHTSWMFWKWWWPGYSSSGVNIEYAPCHELEIINVWQQKFPKMTSSFVILTRLIFDSDVIFGNFCCQTFIISSSWQGAYSMLTPDEEYPGHHHFQNIQLVCVK